MGLWDIAKRVSSGIMDKGLSAYDRYRDFKDEYKDMVPPGARKFFKHKGRQAVGGLAAAFRPEDSKYVDTYEGPRQSRPMYDRYGNYGGGYGDYGRRNNDYMPRRKPTYNKTNYDYDYGDNYAYRQPNPYGRRR